MSGSELSLTAAPERLNIFNFQYTAVTELITPANAEAPAEVPVTKAVNEVKKAVAPICQQLTLDFGPDF